MRVADAEDELEQYLTLAGGAFLAYERQYRYVPGRKFAADFAFPAARLLVEIQGGIFSRQAHGSIAGVLKDIERGNMAALHGWRVLRFTPDDLSTERIAETLDIIERCLSGEGSTGGSGAHRPTEPPPM